MSDQLHGPPALPPGKEQPVPIGWGLGGPQSRYGRSGEEKKVSAPAENRTSVVQLVA
jgi:hypothetical protein